MLGIHPVSSEGGQGCTNKTDDVAPKYFEMSIWHPASEKALDELLDAKVDM